MVDYITLFFFFFLSWFRIIWKFRISKKKKIFEEEIDRVVFSPKRITVPVNDR